MDLPDGARAGDALRDVTVRHPATAADRPALSLAVNLEVVPAEHPLADGRRGRAAPARRRGRVPDPDRPAADGPFGVEEALAAVGGARRAGGTVVFLGTVRDASDGVPVERLEYSAYAEMAERVLEEVAEEAAAKWPLEGGGDPARGGDAAGRPPHGRRGVLGGPSGRGVRGVPATAIDEVKRRVPIWKKEIGPRAAIDGSGWRTGGD